MVLIAIFAPYLGTVDPTALAPAQRTRAPSAQYWFGTDMLGRDVYSRVIYGTRVSLIGRLRGGAARLGRSALAIGLIAGFIRGVDAIVMRVMDGLMSIPPLLAIALMALTRGQRAERHHRHHHRRNPRVVAARARRGADRCASSPMSRPRSPPAPACRDHLRHILPNTLAPLMVQAHLHLRRRR